MAMHGDGWSVVSATPELFLRRRGDVVGTMPIKGTRPANDPERIADKPKDRAEHVMIVDLERNDLGADLRAPQRARAGLPGGAADGRRPAPGLDASRGACALGVGLAELLRATFPGGSITGAPKVAAIDHIARLEPVGRGASMGALGRVYPNGDLELGLTIRTFAIAAGEIHLWVGRRHRLGLRPGGRGRGVAREGAAAAARCWALPASDAGPDRGACDRRPGRRRQDLGGERGVRAAATRRRRPRGRRHRCAGRRVPGARRAVAATERNLAAVWGNVPRAGHAAADPGQASTCTAHPSWRGSAGRRAPTGWCWCAWPPRDRRWPSGLNGARSGQAAMASWARTLVQADELAAEAVPAHVVETDRRTVTEVAAEIAGLLGWA